MLSFMESIEQKMAAFDPYQIYKDYVKSNEGVLDSHIKEYSKDLTQFNVDTDAFDKINKYISNATFNEKIFIHKQQSNLPFSLAYDPFERKVFLKTRGLAPIGFGSTCNLVAGVDLRTNTKVVYRTMPAHKVTRAERDINISLSERSDLFVATKEIYDYEGSCVCDDKGDFVFKQVSKNITKQKNPIHKKLMPKTCFILENLIMDLFDLLNFEKLNVQDKIEISCDIAKALDVLHNEYNVVHRDLKLENIYISENSNSVNKKYHAKVADFGQSEYFGKVPKIGSGTYEYISPEWFSYEIENEKNGTPNLLPKSDYSSDMWSFGIILFELFGGKLSSEYWEFDESEMPPEDYSCFKKKLMATIDIAGDGRRADIVGLIDLCLEVNPKERITAKQAFHILQTLQLPTISQQNL
ncbi:MAG TPA: protein kinase [Parachlamydiaceae bacterium]|nr:protein kinase [Parachlamydiaceae bacterium]